MTTYTVHTRDETPPVLVREGFSCAALVFGPLWLLVHRAWIAALLSMCAYVAIGMLPDRAIATALWCVLAWLIGLFGNDLWRWSLDRRGFVLEEVVLERSRERALGRLLDRRPDLIEDAAL